MAGPTETAAQIGIHPLELRLANYADTDPIADRPWSSERLSDVRERRAGPDRSDLSGFDGTQTNHFKETNMSETHIPLTPKDAAILLIDHQPGVLAMVNNLPRDMVAANVGTLARLGEQTELPIVITSVNEKLDILGTNIDEIRDGAPTAYANRVARDGILNAFGDPRFVDAVAATGRQKLIMAGILTDICLWHSAVSALDAGYHVLVVADAGGTTSELADRVTYDRLRGLGAEVGTTRGTLFDLFPDLSTPEGELAEAILGNGQDLAPA